MRLETPCYVSRNASLMLHRTPRRSVRFLAISCRLLFGDSMDKEQFKNSVFALIYRAGHESDLTLREMVQALHECAEHVMFLEERHERDVEASG